MPDTGVKFDVVVVGGGNAGFSAAHAAAERGRRVIVLEKGSGASPGGNSYYTAGATRIAHQGLDDIRDVLEPDFRLNRTLVPPYSPDEYVRDLVKVTAGKTDLAMAEVLATESGPVLRWLHTLGLHYRLMYERQAYSRQDGSFLFWGGLHLGNVDGGRGLVRDHLGAAERLGTVVQYNSRVTSLLTADGDVVGVKYIDESGNESSIRAQSVVLAAGGFEANRGWRERYLGPGWGAAKVRGTPHNVGDMIKAALQIGAARGGDWATCHSIQWDAEAKSNESNRTLTNRLSRQGYPLGIIVDRTGRRFLDEGADFRNYTYAKYGAEILKRPGSVAWQVFDATTRPMLRSEEYEMPGISVQVADTLEGLAEASGFSSTGFAAAVDDFNASIDRTRRLDPTVRDGLRADTEPPKSNWASPIETAPFFAFPVTCGITFTFGGVRGDLDGRVLREDGSPIAGLFSCGEMLGGLFSGNYPGGSGLAAGMVFGRRAGSVA